jgi:hypothetical protein
MRRLAALALIAVAAAGCGGSSHDPATPAGWRLAAVPAEAGPALLTGVSCVSADFCVAVGSRFRNLVSNTLVERWDGTAWKVVTTGDELDAHSGLNGVSCVSAEFCVAVGSHFDNGGSHGLIEMWDGRRWRVAPRAPVPSVLSGVACSSTTFCVAVGTTRESTPSTLTEVWRGRGWTRVVGESSPGTTGLAAVSCLSGPFCVAVGQRSRGSLVSTLASSFDGTRWRLETSPGVSVFSNLSGVSCVSRDWCVAVGSHFHGLGSRTLVLRREGPWSLRPSPSRSFRSSFTGVSCVAETSCVAVGSQRDVAANRGLLAVWDGTEWSFAGIPNAPGTDVLAGVSCAPELCVAVGSSGPPFGVASRPVVYVSEAE